MQVRPHSTLKILLALFCAMGAGFSGDLYSHHSPSHHASRRSTPHRGNRSVSRGGYTDHSADVETLQFDHAHAPPGAQAAVLPPSTPLVQPVWAELGVLPPITIPAFQSVVLPEWAPRPPPALS
jgi:hypothetical protein